LIAKHLEECDGCRAYHEQVKRQRAELGVLLPVVASPWLKEGILQAAGGTVSTTAAGAGGSSILWSGGGVGKAAATVLAVGALGAGAIGTVWVGRAIGIDAEPQATTIGQLASSTPDTESVRTDQVDGVPADAGNGQPLSTDQLVELTVNLLGLLGSDDLLALTDEQLHALADKLGLPTDELLALTGAPHGTPASQPSGYGSDPSSPSPGHDGSQSDPDSSGSGSRGGMFGGIFGGGRHDNQGNRGSSAKE
jgi:hypothetical protein